MRNFQKIAENVDVMPLMHALARNSQLWNENKFRTSFPNTPHVDVDDILLRFSDTTKCETTSQVIGDDNPIWLEPSKILLPHAQDMILNLMRWTKAYDLGRVIVSRIKPGGRILAHADNDGAYVKTDDRARYHIALQGLPGSLYTCGDETVCMKTGEIWWFNAHEIHHVENNSADDRIHLLVDVRTM